MSITITDNEEENEKIIKDREKFIRYVKTKLKNYVNLYRQEEYELANKFIESMPDSKIKSIFKRYEYLIFNYLSNDFDEYCDVSIFNNLFDFKKWMIKEAIYVTTKELEYRRENLG